MKSPEKVCSVCGGQIIIAPKLWKDTPGQADIYCSVGCIKSLLVQEKENPGKVKKRISTINPIVSDEYSAYSAILKTAFRSKFEVLVAEYLEREKINFLYEKITLELFGGTRHWTPDFYIPDSRVFIEVKGMWALGGRKKYVEAMKTIAESIVLIPYWMKKLF